MKALLLVSWLISVPVTTWTFHKNRHADALIRPQCRPNQLDLQFVWTRARADRLLAGWTNHNPQALERAQDVLRQDRWFALSYGVSLALLMACLDPHPAAFGLPGLASVADLCEDECALRVIEGRASAWPALMGCFAVTKFAAMLASAGYIASRFLILYLP